MDPTLIATLVGIGVAIAVLVLALRRGNRGWLVAAAGVTALSGAQAALLGAGHVFGVAARALSGRGAGNAPFTYDFRFYSLLLVGFLLVVPGAAGVVAALGLTRRRLESWRSALRSSCVLFAVNAPLAPIQGFAYLLAGLAAVSLVLLAIARRSIEPRG